MAWGDRIQKPNGDKVVALHDLSKEQLAAALNELGARFKALREQHQIASNALAAIAMEPEAFQYLHGGVTIDMAAFEKARNGKEQQLLIDQDGTVLRLRLVDPAAPALETPRILVPRH